MVDESPPPPPASRLGRVAKSPWLWLAVGVAAFFGLPFAASGLRSVCRLLVIWAVVYGGWRFLVWAWHLRPGARLALCVFLLGNYLMVEAASWVAVKTILRPAHSDAHRTLTEDHRKALHLMMDNPGFLAIEVHPVLGWSHQANSPNRPTNNRALRGTSRVEDVPAEGVLRVACMGDSFTFGSEVAVEHSWPQLAQGLMEKSEFLNFGIAATGVTQSFLRFEHEARPLRPQVVIIGFLRQNFFRAVNVYRPFLRPESGPPIPQPYAAIENNELVIHPPFFNGPEDIPGFLQHPEPTLSKLFRRDYIMQHFVENTSGSPLWRLGRRLARTEAVRDSANTLVKQTLIAPKPDLRDLENSSLDADPHLFEVNRRLMAKYIQSVRDAGAVPVVLIYAGKLDIKNFNKGKELLYKSFQNSIAREGVEIIEVIEELSATLGAPLDSDRIFKVGHYNEATNHLVAQSVVARLRSLKVGE